MPTLKGTVYGWLVTVSLLWYGAQGSAPTCCDSGATWIGDSRNCSDGTRIRLHCSHGFYAMQPFAEPNEQFHIIERDNISWLSISGDEEVDGYSVAPSSYCISELADVEDQEIALICFPEQVESQPIWRDIFFGLFSMLSSLFLALTLLVYLVLPEMRDIQDKAIMSVTASFMIAFFLNGNQRLNFPPLEEDSTCLIVAFIMYYAYLCAFFWLNIISLNIWRSVWFPNFKIRCDVLFIVYSIIGWGLPLCFLATSLTTHHIESYLKPGFGEVNCWFNGYYATWMYFYGPIMALLSINLVYLALTSWKLWRQYRELNCCKLKVLRFRCVMYVKLAIMMGFTWIFEILSFASGETNQFYWILPDILNVLQGLFIFILLVVSRKRVRKLLAKRRPFNIPFPKSWAAYEDEENCEQAVPEELELELP